MSSLNSKKIKLSKHIITSLDTSTKNSNSVKSYLNKSKNFELNKNNSQCILPVINSSIKKNFYLEPTSILTKFIQNRSSNIIKNSIENLLTPKIMFPGRNYLNMYRSRSVNVLNENSQNSPGIFITEKQKIIRINRNKRVLSKIKSNNNIINKNNNTNNIIFEKNNTGEEITNIKNTIDNEESFINEKELNNIKIQYSNLVSDIGYSSRIITPNNNDSIELKKKFLKNKDVTYTRLCKYEPIKIKSNRNKIKSAFKKSNSINFFHVYNPDIDYQMNTFDEQFKLFKENFKEYKNIINKRKYIEIFKSISLSTKRKCNICLEETCGIFNILPKLILGDYYNLMKGLIQIDIPDAKKFIPKFIHDEIKILSYNNDLLIEVYNYFNKCFDFYVLLSKKEEVKSNYLKEKDYFEALNYFETARNNISYLNNSFYNSEQNYIDDLLTINQIIKDKYESYNDEISNEMIDNIKEEEIKKNLNKKMDIIEKIEKQCLFKKNPEKEKKNRIESALGIMKEERPIINYLGKILKRKKIEYKSIFNNKHFDKILNHCNKDIRDKIITQKINNEINFGKPKKGYQALKINFS